MSEKASHRLYPKGAIDTYSTRVRKKAFTGALKYIDTSCVLRARTPPADAPVAALLR